MTTSLAPALATTRPSIPRQLLIDSRHAVLGLPLGVMSFVLLIAGFSLSAGLLVTTLGIPVLAGTLFAARGFADVERWRIAAVLRMPRIRPTYRDAGAGAGYWRRLFTPIGQLQFWLDFGHGVLRLIPDVIAFCVVVVWWAGALGGSLYVTYDWALPHPPSNRELHELLGLTDSAGTRIWFNTAIGVFFLLTLPLVARAAAVLSASFARALLTGVAEVRDRISTLSEQRAAAVSAEATALRRLERDIHDGPQQRLVRLAMDLGRAQEQVGSDPSAAGARWTRRSASPARRWTSCARSPAASPRRCSPTAGCPARWPRWPAAARYRWSWRCSPTWVRPAGGSTPRWRTPPTSWWPRRWPTRPSTATRPSAG